MRHALGFLLAAVVQAVRRMAYRMEGGRCRRKLLCLAPPPPGFCGEACLPELATRGKGAARVENAAKSKVNRKSGAGRVNLRFGPSFDFGVSFPLGLAVFGCFPLIFLVFYCDLGPF